MKTGIINEEKESSSFSPQSLEEQIFDKLMSLVSYDGHNVSVWACDLIKAAREYISEDRLELLMNKHGVRP